MKRFIVAEISKSWCVGESLPVKKSELLSGMFEDVIETNRLRGYRLYEFALAHGPNGPGIIIETIIAVFEAESERVA